MKKLILFSSVLISCCFAMDTDTWDGKKYDENSNKQFALAIKHIQLIKDEIQEDWNILDVGCGSGRVAHWLAENQVPKGSVTGIDKSKSMIKTAQAKKPTIVNLSFAHCSAEKLSENERFDLVTCFAVMHWIKDQKAVIQNIANILKPNGIFISSWIEKKPMPQLRAWFKSRHIPSPVSFNSARISFWERGAFADTSSWFSAKNFTLLPAKLSHFFIALGCTTTCFSPILLSNCSAFLTIFFSDILLRATYPPKG